MKEVRGVHLFNEKQNINNRLSIASVRVRTNRKTTQLFVSKRARSSRYPITNNQRLLFYAYFAVMKEDSVVHFVCFDTTLDITPFMQRWEEYTRSVNSDADVTMQQSITKNSFRYIAQHHCSAGELRFAFTKSSKRSHHIVQTSITEQEVGGYSVLQAERKGNTHANESKIFVFINSAQADIEAYKHLSIHGKLNIYHAYYENCKYSFIMEYFIQNKYAASLVEHLNKFADVETGVYKQYLLQGVF